MPQISSHDPQEASLAQDSLAAVVLDTNVVLDWLVFGDSSCRELSDQLASGLLRWQATNAMRAELCSVLPRAELMAWKPDVEHVLSVFDALASLRPVAPALPNTDRLRCRDDGDQKFIDLAVAVGARWLFSRDRALLALAKPALQLGVTVLTPTEWLRRHRAPTVRSDCTAAP